MPASFLHTEKFQSNYYNEMHHIYAQYYTSDLFFPSGKITPLTSPDKKKIKLKWTDLQITLKLRNKLLCITNLYINISKQFHPHLDYKFSLIQKIVSQIFSINKTLTFDYYRQYCCFHVKNACKTSHSISYLRYMY